MSLLIFGASEFNYYEITFHFGTGNYDDTLYVTGQLDGLGSPGAGDHGDESELIWAAAEALAPVMGASRGEVPTVTAVKYHSPSDREVEAPE